MRAKIHHWLRGDDGAAALDYGLVLALVSIGAIVALQSLGLSLVGLFEHVDDLLQRVNTKLR